MPSFFFYSQDGSAVLLAAACDEPASFQAVVDAGISDNTTDRVRPWLPA